MGVNRGRFKGALAGLLAALKKNSHPVLVVRSSFWADQTKDELLRQDCAEAGGVFVDIGALGKDEPNMARAERKIEHAGLGAHPGDKGMQAIAEALWKALAPAK